MKHLIMAGKQAVKAWLVGHSHEQPVTTSGVALLDIQLSELEKRCAAIRTRMERLQPGKASKGRNQNGNNSHPKRGTLFHST
jgi:hypothetical protein